MRMTFIMRSGAGGRCTSWLGKPLVLSLLLLLLPLLHGGVAIIRIDGFHGAAMHDGLESGVNDAACMVDWQDGSCAYRWHAITGDANPSKQA